MKGKFNVETKGKRSRKNQIMEKKSVIGIGKDKLIDKNDTTSAIQFDASQAYSNVFEQYKIIQDFQLNTLKDAIGVLEKGISFFLIIMALLTGYIFGTKDPIPIHQQLCFIKAAIVTIIIVTIAVCALSIGIYKGLCELKETMQLMNKDVWHKIKIDSYMRRGILTTLIVIIAGVIFILTILAFYIYLLDLKGKEIYGTTSVLPTNEILRKVVETNE
jgi:hypothetical protein